MTKYWLFLTHKSYLGSPGHTSRDQCLMSKVAGTETHGAADWDRHSLCLTQRRKHYFICETMREGVQTCRCCYAMEWLFKHSSLCSSLQDEYTHGFTQWRSMISPLGRPTSLVLEVCFSLHGDISRVHNPWHVGMPHSFQWLHIMRMAGTVSCLPKCPSPPFPFFPVSWTLEFVHGLNGNPYLQDGTPLSQHQGVNYDWDKKVTVI